MRYLFALLVFVWASAFGASTQVLSTGVSLWRGTSKLSDVSNRVVDPANNTLTVLSPENCPGIRDRIIQRDALTRTTGSATYRCQIDLRAAVTFRTNPTCQPPRAPETRQENCPAGTTGTFQQTRTWTIAPYPTCEIAGAWLPATPPETDCPLPPLPAPTGVTATTISTSEIRVRWNVVPDAVAYSVRRCIGATCEPNDRTPLTCTQALEQPHVTLNSGITVNYRIAASRTADCSAQLGTPSDPIVTGTTLSATPTPVDCAVSAWSAWSTSAWSTCSNGSQSRTETRTRTITTQPTDGGAACPALSETRTVSQTCTTPPTGTASLSWTPATRNTDGTSLTNLAGYWIHYGASATELVNTIQVANPGATTYSLSNLSPGTYFFAVRAYTSTGAESANSNIVSKVLQ